MIISASRRTDIPSFYSEWFFNRIKEGYVLVKNPVNRKQVFRVKLNYEDVDAFVFWTKNPAPMIRNLHKLDGYSYYFLFTITPYGPEIEKNLPGKNIIIDNFKKLAEIIGPDKVIWRYDPIIITPEFNIEFHKESFSRMACQLQGYTRKCIFSFITYYDKCIKNMAGVNYSVPGEKEKFILVSSMAQSAGENKIKLQSCSERNNFNNCGITRDGCISSDLVAEISGRDIIPVIDKNQRNGCLCASSMDIGAYNTCINRCIYCYANKSTDAAQKNHKEHNPLSPIITGRLNGDEKIFTKPADKAASASGKDKQGILF